jgi:hypothetical protein
MHVQCVCAINEREFSSKNKSLMTITMLIYGVMEYRQSTYLANNALTQKKAKMMVDGLDINSNVLNACNDCR